MWTIYLVEDEIFVRQAIRETLDWEAHGFQVIGEAGNGKEALTEIKCLQPDIVLTDIVMPGMDGIELLKLAREAGVPSRFIMLTAMSDFDYARDALQYGAFNYLLKLSLSDDILLENLSQIKSEWVRDLENKGESLHAVYYQIWTALWIRNGALETVIKGISVPAMIHKLQLTIYTTLHTEDSVVFHWISNNPDVVMLHTFTELDQTTYFCWSKQAREKRAVTSICKDIIVAQVCGNSLASLAQDWRAALEMLDDQWYEGKRTKQELQAASLSMKELEDELLRCFDERHETKCKEVADSIWQIMQDEGLCHVEVKMAAVRLADAIVLLSRQNDIRPIRLQQEQSHRMLLAAMKQFIEDALRRLNELDGLFTDHPEVNLTIRYMLDHYSENIMVKDLAKLAAMNVDYLSTLFGRKTGQSPIAFLQRIRIERAKRLLLYSEWSVREIAEQTGFADDAYFIKLFKRTVGLTPSAFRKSNMI